MRIAITGATGHIGSNLCPYLLERGHNLKLLVYESSVNYSDAQVVRGSVLEPETVFKLVQDVDVVVHLAAKISLEPDKTGELRAVNVQGTQNVVDACLGAGVKQLIHFSSIHTFDPYPLEEPLDESRGYMEAGTDYDYSKIEGEKIVVNAQERGLVSTILCPTSVFGPNDFQPSLLGSAIMDMHDGKVPMLVPGGYDFVDVRDIVEATYQAIVQEPKGEKYLLAGKYLSIQELAKIVGELSHKNISQRVAPIGLLKRLLPLFRVQSWLTGKPPIFTEQSLKALMEGHQDVRADKAQKDLGYTRSDIKQSLSETINWFLSQREAAKRPR